MFGFRPQYWSLIALLLALVHPSASHPVRTPKWVKKDQFADPESRGVWKVFEKTGYKYGLELPQAKSIEISPITQNDDSSIEKGPPGRHYKHDSSYGKSTVSVLVPVAPDSLPPPLQPEHHRHDAHGKPQEPSFEVKTYADHYGEIMGHPQSYRGKQTGETATFSSAKLKLASGHSISFFSYRIPLPFLKFAPANFPQYPLPGIFTTVMVLLAMVWIAIFMIGLVELGNYLWKRRAARQAEREGNMSEGLSEESEELIKVPMRVMVAPRVETDCRDEMAALLSSGSESDSGSDLERDDYRF